jgi:hypothetical protein
MDGLIDGCIVSGTLMLILSRIWLLTFINEIHFCFLNLHFFLLLIVSYVLELQ